MTNSRGLSLVGAGGVGDLSSYTFLVAVRGDVNLDGKVDITDFNALATNYDPLGTNLENDWSKANFDGDADVDMNDFNAIVQNYSPHLYATQAASVASRVAPLAVVHSGSQAVESGEALVTEDAAVKVRQDQVPTDHVFASWDDSAEEYTRLPDTSGRRRERLVQP